MLNYHRRHSRSPRFSKRFFGGFYENMDVPADVGTYNQLLSNESSTLYGSSGTINSVLNETQTTGQTGGRRRRSKSPRRRVFGGARKSPRRKSPRRKSPKRK